MYTASKRNQSNPYEESFDWGWFVTYAEYGSDGFASRSVVEYENGYLARYDRVHWQDQFGALPDFRMGKAWRKHWGEPNQITKEEFEAKWIEAESSGPFVLRTLPPAKKCPWIELFEAGKWKGQP